MNNTRGRTGAVGAAAFCALILAALSAVLVFAAASCTSGPRVTAGGSTNVPTEAGFVPDANPGGSDACTGLACGGPAQTCNASCDCPTAGQACVGGTCGTPPAGGCQNDTDCACADTCTGFESGTGHCIPRCHADTDCTAPTAFCYLPMGKCGPCINDAQCGAGHCTNGVCQGGDAGTPSGPPSCTNSSQCGPSEPVCFAATSPTQWNCSPCYTGRDQCGDGYFRQTNACVPEADAGIVPGACDGGCTGGLRCDVDAGACVPTTCHPACGSPARCDPATSQCICDHCGGACFTGEVCDENTCTCVTAQHPDTTTTPSCLDGHEGCPCPFCQGCAPGLTCKCLGGDTCSFISSCYATVGAGLCVH